MNPTFTPDQRDVIVEHKHATTLHVLCASRNLRDLADRAGRQIPKPRTTAKGSYGRSVSRVPHDEAPRVVPLKGSWCLAILADEDASWPPLTAMGRRLGVEQIGRITFHIGADLDPVAILEPWLDLDSTPTFRTYVDEKNLVKHLLEQLNDQTLSDHTRGAIPGV